MIDYEKLKTILNDYINSALQISIKAGFAILVCYVIYKLIVLVRNLLNLKNTYKEDKSVINIVPPNNLEWENDSLSSFLKVIHASLLNRKLKDRILGKTEHISFEIESTKSKGINYKFIVPNKYTPLIKKQLHAYVPDAKISEDKFEKNNLYVGIILPVMQKSNYVYPIYIPENLPTTDVVSFINSMMTKLESTSVVTYQLVLTPLELKSAYKKLDKLKKKERLAPKAPLFIVFDLFFKLIEAIGYFFTLIGDEIVGYRGTSNNSIETTSNHNPVSFTNIDQEHFNYVASKLTSELFSCSIKLNINTKSKKEKSEIIRGFQSIIKSTNYQNYQGLAVRRGYTISALNRIRRFEFNHRLPSTLGKNKIILSSKEVSTLYHFPYSHSAQIENVVKSLSKTLPAPVSLKGANKLDLIIGQNFHQEQTTPIGLTEEERARHCYVIGGTGSGKSTLLLYSIMQDIKNGKGVAIIDPHGDLSEDILKLIPEHRIKDVVYFNPYDSEYPIGINLLEMPPNLSPIDYKREKELVTESTVSIFKKMFSKTGESGHRIEYLIRNTVHTALTTENPTLFTIYKLLNNPKYCNSVVEKLTDENLKDFWENEMGKAGDFARVKIAAGVTAKVGRFLQSPSAYPILAQEKSSINFEDIINDGKIMICNISKGLIGEDTSELFGITLLSKFQLAALKRAKLPKNKRKPFYIYVDEFQNFTTTSFIEMLAEARKYKLFLTMAQQTTSQQENQIVNTILANVGTIICFRSSNPQDMKYMYPIFSPYLEETEISYLPAYNFYMRISAINPLEPFSGQTIVIEDTGSEEVMQKAIEHSRKNYANPHYENTPPEPLLTTKQPQKPKSKVNGRAFK